MDMLPRGKFGLEVTGLAGSSITHYNKCLLQVVELYEKLGVVEDMLRELLLYGESPVDMLTEILINLLRDDKSTVCRDVGVLKNDIRRVITCEFCEGEIAF